MNTRSITGLTAVLIAAAALTAAAAPPKAGPKIGDYKGKNHNAIPDNCYGVFSFADAAKESAKKKKPIVVLVTDERADDTAVKAAGAKAFWAVEDDAIMVVLRLSTSGDWTRLPDDLQKSVKSADLGKGFPKMVVMNDDATVVLAGLNSSKLIEMDEKALNKVGKELKKLNAAKTASTDYPPPSLEAPKPATPAPAPAAPATPPAKPATPAGTTPPAPAPAPAPAAPAAPTGLGGSAQEAWTNAAGQTIQATLLEVNGAQVTFLMANGNKVPYELQKLSPASQKRVQELATKK